MGHKVHPKALRLGYIADWDSRWFSRNNFAAYVIEDAKIREFIQERLRFGAVSKVGIERAGQVVRIFVFTARPGVVIGKKGADIEGLRQEIERITGKKVVVKIMEIRIPELDAKLVSEGIAMQLEKKIGFRRAMKKAIERTMDRGALGIKVQISGRLGGAEIARREWLKEGRVPLHTFRADIDYGFTEAITKYGRIGVKAWIFKEEMFKKSEKDILKGIKPIEKIEEVVPAVAEKTAEQKIEEEIVDVSAEES
ncbi:MAG: 30S ribosomal protein S3 [Elusimicrobiota bacterium]